MFTSFRFGIVLLVCCWYIRSRVQACSCIAAHPQITYCNPNKFVIAIYVKSSTIIPGPGPFPGTGHKEITVNVLNDFKDMVPSGDIILTAPELDCTVNLDLNECYIISGSITAGTPDTHNINSCEFVQKCSQVTFTQWSGFFAAYEQNCGCQIGGSADGACPYNFSFDLACLSEYAICQGTVSEDCLFKRRCGFVNGQGNEKGNVNGTNNGKPFQEIECPITDCQWVVAENPDGDCT